MTTESTNLSPVGHETTGEFVEGIRLRQQPAPTLRRMFALAIDFGILSAVSYAAILVALIPFGAAGAVLFKSLKDKSAGIAGAIVFSVFVVLFLLALLSLNHIFFIYYEYKRGATPGKRMMGLKVVDASGGPITKKQAVYRDLVRFYIDLLFFLPGLISILVTKNRQRVGDLMANTFVVYAKGAEERDKHLYVKREDYLAILEHLGPIEVDAETCRNYLAFASRAYLMNDAQALQNYPQWLQTVRQILPRSVELDLNDFTVMRFFAEYCFQQDLKEKQPKKG